MCLQHHKFQSLNLTSDVFSQNVHVARKVPKMAFWDVSVDTNTVSNTICPCLKRFLFALKSPISKDYIILNFKNQARTLTKNNKGTHH